MGVSSEPSRHIPFHEFQFHLVPLIPHSSIDEQSSSDPLFFTFLPVWKINLKRSKQKRRIVFQNLQNIFSFV